MLQSTPETRGERGRRLLDEIDGEAGHAVIAGLQDIAPDFAELLFEFPFGDVYAREGLSLRDREIATVAALSAMATAPKQLGVHVQGALNVGVTRQEIVEIMIQMSVYAGFPAALNALAVAREVFSARDAKVEGQ